MARGPQGNPCGSPLPAKPEPLNAWDHERNVPTTFLWGRNVTTDVHDVAHATHLLKHARVNRILQLVHHLLRVTFHLQEQEYID